MPRLEGLVEQQHGNDAIHEKDKQIGVLYIYKKIIFCLYIQYSFLYIKYNLSMKRV